jgi:hypothetical protein
MEIVIDHKCEMECKIGKLYMAETNEHANNAIRMRNDSFEG